MDAPPPPPYDKAADQAAYLGVPDSPPAYVMGALVGGLVAGMLGVCGGCCCAPLWGGLGGFLAAFMASRPAFLFGPTEGAISGAAAGAAASLLNAGISIPLQLGMQALMKNNPQFLDMYPPAIRDSMRMQLQQQGLGTTLLGVGMTVVVLFMSCVIGGTIGGLIRRKDGGAL